MWRSRLKLVRLLLVLLGVGWVRGELRQNVSAKTSLVRDIVKFPVCVTDDDCDNISDKKHQSYKCFQYMCYPWKSKSLGQPFRTCKRRSDCKALSLAEGGDGGNGDCYRHQDRRTVFSGICLSDSDMAPCFEHSDCKEGRKCTNQFCGEEQYFSALGELTCKKDSFCQDMLLGTHCCFDIRGGLSAWDSGEPDWGRKCCSNKAAPVKRPPDDISNDQIKKLNQKINVHFKKFEIDNLICKGLKYEMMLKLSACDQYKTTTTTTRKPTTTKSSKQRRNQETNSSLRNLLSNFLILLVALTVS
jgi:hypothetical protein